MKKESKFIFAGWVTVMLVGAPVFASDLKLKAPSESQNGSYILRLESNDTRSKKQNGMLELYRNIDGGQYKMLMTVPYFSALSQLVKQNGIYGYKIRWVTGEYNGEFSEPVFVKVQSRVPMLSPDIEPRRHRVSSEMDVGSR